MVILEHSRQRSGANGIVKCNVMMDLRTFTSPTSLPLYLYVIALVTFAGNRVDNPGGKHRNKKSGNWSSKLGVERWANNLSPQNSNVQKPKAGPRIGLDQRERPWR